MLLKAFSQYVLRYFVYPITVPSRTVCGEYTDDVRLSVCQKYIHSISREDIYHHLGRNFELRDVNTISIIIFSTVIKQKFFFSTERSLSFNSQRGLSVISI